MGKNVESAFQDYYRELLALARLRLAREQAPVSTCTLANELYLKMHDRNDLQFSSLEEFLAYSSRALRNLLVDMARERIAQKRSAELLPLTLGLDIADNGATPEQILALNDVLERLGRSEPRLMQVAEMRAILGMDISDIASTLAMSERTVKRDWQKAKAFLFEALSSSDA